MIIINLHEAKARLSELVQAVEERDETVVICQDGVAVAEIRRCAVRDLTPEPRLRVEFAPGYDPTEPLQPDELAGHGAPLRRDPM